MILQSPQPQQKEPVEIKLLLVDLDQTVRRKKSSPNGFINEPLDQEIIPAAAEALERWKGCTIIACSNQAGVAAGYMTLGQCIDAMVYTMELAPQIKSVFFSPDSDGKRCFCVRPDGSIQTVFCETFKDLSIRTFRKPGCGMLKLAMFRYGASNLETGMIGDRDEDRLAAISAGVNFMPETRWYESGP